MLAIFSFEVRPIDLSLIHIFRNKAISNAGTTTVGIFEGKESSPNKKKMSICISPVIPSKKFTSDFLFLIGRFPIIIPTI